MGIYDPSFLYSAPPGLVEFNKTPYVTSTNLDGSQSVTGGNVIYNTPIVNQPAQYIAPKLLGAPECSSGPSMFTQECIDVLLANQQKDMGSQNKSNYDVFLANCLNTFPQPTDCYQRTFGMTPVGGYTGSYVGNVPVGVDAQKFITGIPNSQAIQIPVKSSQAEQTKQIVNANEKVGSGNITVGGQDISSIVDQVSAPVSVMGFDIPVWAIGVAVVGGLFVVSKMGGR